MLTSDWAGRRHYQLDSCQIKLQLTRPHSPSTPEGPEKDEGPRAAQVSSPGPSPKLRGWGDARRGARPAFGRCGPIPQELPEVPVTVELEELNDLYRKRLKHNPQTHGSTRIHSKVQRSCRHTTYMPPKAAYTQIGSTSANRAKSISNPPPPCKRQCSSVSAELCK